MFVDQLVNIFVPELQVDLQGSVVPLVVRVPASSKDKSLQEKIGFGLSCEAVAQV